MARKKPNLYKLANEEFLTAKAQEEGMVVLDNGVMYRILEEGYGTRKPAPRSIVVGPFSFISLYEPNRPAIIHCPVWLILHILQQFKFKTILPDSGLSQSLCRQFQLSLVLHQYKYK